MLHHPVSPTHSSHLANQYQRTLNTLPSTVAEQRHNIPLQCTYTSQPLPGTPPKKVGTSWSPTQTSTICEYYRAELQLPTTMQEHFIFSAVDNTFQELPPRKYLPGNTSGENAVTLQFKYSLTHPPSLPATISLQELSSTPQNKGHREPSITFPGGACLSLETAATTTGAAAAKWCHVYILNAGTGMNNQALL